MTTVVALARDGRVAMAADTQTNVYERPIVGAAHKILRFAAGRGGEALLACSGDGATVPVLAAGLSIVTVPGRDDDAQAWADEVAASATKLLVDAGIVRDERIDTTMLLGYGGRLWTLTHRQAIPHPDGVAAIGSGEGPAIGALDALLAVAPQLADGELVGRACAIGINRDRYSAGPIELHLLDAAGGDDAPAAG